jgi:hypothetical protein
MANPFAAMEVWLAAGKDLGPAVDQDGLRRAECPTGSSRRKVLSRRQSQLFVDYRGPTRGWLVIPVETLRQ